MKRKRPMHEAMDAGSPQMARHFSIVPKLTDPTTMSMKVMNGSEIDAMLFRDDITTMQHATLSTLAKRLHGYGFVGLKSPDYSSPVFSDPSIVSDKKAQTIRGAVHLFEKLDQHPDIGSYRRKRLVQLVLQDAPWANVEELNTVTAALDSIFMRRG